MNIPPAVPVRLTISKGHCHWPALARLYIHQAGSREMSVWRAKVRGTLAVTHQGRVEVITAICRAAFLGQLDPDGLAEALADLTTDFASGHLRQEDILWRAALNGAAELREGRLKARQGRRKTKC